MDENEVVEQLVAATENLADAVEATSGFTSRQYAIVAVSVVAGTAIGAFVGYRFAEKRLSTKFDKMMQDESAQLREHYSQKIRAKMDKPSIEEMAERAELHRQTDTYKETVVDLGYIPKDEAPMDEPEKADEPIMQSETTNIFQERDKAQAEISEWDYAKESKARNPQFPYVIHVDEWQQNDTEYEKMDLTYYEGDEVLTDDNDNVIPEVEETVGFENLSKFGHGSGDPNVVFIRNDVREILYEVARSSGMYAHEVHGFDPEQLSHSDERRRDRRRFDDD